MIPKERFQFSHSIDEIVETSIVGLQVKKIQDGPVEGIYYLNPLIWNGNHVKSPMAQLVCQDFLIEDFLFTKS